ncbi:MAG: hypothetical protein KDI31_01155 [Pseudomonadales bacterium]|nr:hypothetical protein [Pseudomonadales bacterium]
MTARRPLSLLLLLCFLSACVSPISKLAKLTPDEAAEMSDKQICDRISWNSAEKYPVFNSEIDRRGLSLNQCCYQRLIRSEPLCLGQVMGEKGTNGTFPPAETVTLILDRSAVQRPYITIGTVYDAWNENTGTGVVLDSDIGPLFQKQLTSPEYGFRPLSIRFIEQRFEERYREQAQEIGADALIVTIADRMKFEAPLILGAPATTTNKGEKVRLYFDAIRYTD